MLRACGAGAIAVPGAKGTLAAAGAGAGLRGHGRVGGRLAVSDRDPRTLTGKKLYFLDLCWF